MTNPRGEVTTRICDYYLTPQGCVKGNQCSFLHPRVVPSSQQSNTRGPNRSGPSAAAGGHRVCEFYNTPHGCHKGPACNFSHVSNFNGNSRGSADGKRTQICDFFFSRKGCNKGETCPFSHTKGPASNPTTFGAHGVEKKPKVCDFYNTERGCVKGDLCDFIHVKNKPCDFYLSERGCKKGALCDFRHVKAGEEGRLESEAGLENRIPAEHEQSDDY